MDDLTLQQRRKTMRAIKSCDTEIERIFRCALWHAGFRYRKNAKSVYGKPDICNKKFKIAIFCDGDFWHGKNYTDKEFTTNKKFWDNKIKRNKERDLEVTITLRDQDWTVMRFWEDEIKNNLDGCVKQVMLTYKQCKTMKKGRYLAKNLEKPCKKWLLHKAGENNDKQQNCCRNAKRN